MARQQEATQLAERRSTSPSSSEVSASSAPAEGAASLLSVLSLADDPKAGSGERDLLRPRPAPASEPKPNPKPATGDATAEEPTAATANDEAADEAKQPSWAVRPSARTTDDPLLGSLTILCALLDRPISADALTAGLPLIDGHMTPELFSRAAQRAGISTRLMRRKLSSINRLSLPCVLLLEGQRACVLTGIQRGVSAEIVLAEMGAGASTVSFSELEREYAGYALFARPEFQFDSRSEEVRTADPSGWFWGTIAASWKIYSEVILAAIMVNCFALASPLFTMNVYDRVVPNFAEETLWVLAAGIITVFTFEFILKMLRSYFVDIAGKTADARIAGRLFQQVLGMKMADRPQSAGALASQLREFEHLRDFFTSSTLTALVDLPFLFLFVFVVYLVGGKVAIVPLAAIPIVVIVGIVVQIPLKYVVQKTSRESSQKHAILVEAISGIETIKSTSSEGRMQRNWENFVALTARSAMKAQSISSLALNFSASATSMVSIGVIVFGVYLIHAGELSVGGLVASTMLTGRAMAPLGQIAGILTRFHQARNSLKALDVLMRTPVERPEGRGFVHRPSFSGHIEFKNVNFTYPGQKALALDDVSFKISAGEKVGIVGRIGSGKSTIERLILGLYEPGEGAVFIDGTDVRQIDPADLRRNIGVVPQDVYLFFGSVKENIAIGAPFADDAMILRAARISGVEEFASRHSAGLDMPVGERGQNLSGGQRQAIAVARALLLDPPILVLDEPTSAMDNTSESRFKARIGNLLNDRTLILITHRGSLLSLVDRIIVMDGARVVADGPKERVLEALASGRIQTAKN